MVELTSPARPSLAVLSHVLLDDIRLPDGRHVTGQLGGAGSYAAAGAALASCRPGSVGVVCGTGADLGTANLEHLSRYGIDTSALQVRDAHAPRSQITYHDESTRDESPVWGPAHLLRMRPDPADVPEGWRPLAGVYLFQDDNHEIFDRLDRVRDDRTVVLWEIDVACCQPDRLPSVTSLLHRVDWLSINFAEARSLLGHDDPDDCVRMLLDAGAQRVSLRMGAAGALIADGESCLRTGAFATPAVDPTGAGNAHGGALLATWVRTLDLRQSASTAAATASFVIEQYGLPPSPPSPTAITARTAVVSRTVERLHRA